MNSLTHKVLEISPDAGVDEDCNNTCLQELHLPAEYFWSSLQARKAYRKLAAKLGPLHWSQRLAGAFDGIVLWSRYHPDVDSSPEATARQALHRFAKTARRIVNPLRCAGQDMFQKVVRALAIITGEAA